MADEPMSQLDSATRVMRLLGERWTFLIIRQAFFGVHRFNAMQRTLGIPRNVLAERLAKLVDVGIFQRRRYREDPDFYEYRLTKKGLDLYPAILALTQWGDRYLAGEDGPPLLLRHTDCGGELADIELTCAACGATVLPSEVEVQTPSGRV